MPQSTLPIINLPIPYINGLGISFLPINDNVSQLLNIALGSASDSNNKNTIILESNVIINGATRGVNGVDVNPLINNEFYAVYIISDSSNYHEPAGLLSLNPIKPIIPAGYDSYRRIGWILTDNSANILPFWQYGIDEQRMYYYDSAINVLLNGNSDTFSLIDLSSAVPPISTEVLFQVIYTPTSASSVAKFITSGSISPITSNIAIYGYGAAAPQEGMITLPAQLSSGNPSILYKVQSNTDTLSLYTAGYKDYLI